MAKAFLSLRLESGAPLYLAVDSVQAIMPSAGGVTVVCQGAGEYHVGCGGQAPAEYAKELMARVVALARDMADTP